MPVRSSLVPDAFGAVERPLVTAGAGRVTGFRYASSIALTRPLADDGLLPEDMASAIRSGIEARLARAAGTAAAPTPA